MLLLPSEEWRRRAVCRRGYRRLAVSPHLEIRVKFAIPVSILQPKRVILDLLSCQQTSLFQKQDTFRGNNQPLSSPFRLCSWPALVSGSELPHAELFASHRRINDHT